VLFSTNLPEFARAQTECRTAAHVSRAAPALTLTSRQIDVSLGPSPFRFVISPVVAVRRGNPGRTNRRLAGELSRDTGRGLCGRRAIVH
jgi:hypothetical protein